MLLLRVDFLFVYSEGSISLFSAVALLFYCVLAVYLVGSSDAPLPTVEIAHLVT